MKGLAAQVDVSPSHSLCLCRAVRARVACLSLLIHRHVIALEDSVAGQIQN